MGSDQFIKRRIRRGSAECIVEGKVEINVVLSLLVAVGQLFRLGTEIAISGIAVAVSGTDVLVGGRGLPGGKPLYSVVLLLEGERNCSFFFFFLWYAL